MRKKFFIPMVFAIILFSTFFSFGFSVVEKIQVYYRSIQIVLNHERLALEKQPFIYGGHIYVPLRFIAQTLGYQVEWNEALSTAYLYDQKGEPHLAPANPLIGESFIYGEITRIDRQEGKIYIEQHLDNNSRDVFNALVVEADAVFLLQRNQHQWNISFSDIRVGDVAGLILTKDHRVRGIIVSN